MREVRETQRPARPLTGLSGRVIGGCRLIRPLGAGGMGEVYLGQQLHLGGRTVAVKLVRPADVTTDPAEVRAIERRFLREGVLLGALAHPNILPVHDCGLDGGYLYLVTPYAPDGSLADAIKGRGALRLRLPVSIPLAANLIGQIAAALQYLHDRGVVHRDVKPGNILLQVQPDGRWRLMLADFGIAHGGESATNAQQIAGTAAYMAPEQLNGHFSAASDQYALGVLAFLLLTRRTPFLGDVADQVTGHLYQTPPPLRTLNSAIPIELAEAVWRALQKNPEDRWPSVAAFAAAARRGAATSVSSPPLRTPPSVRVVPTAPAQLSAPAEADRALTIIRSLPATSSDTTAPETARRNSPDAPATTLPHIRPLAVMPPYALPPVPLTRRPSPPRHHVGAFAATLALLILAAFAALALKDRVTSLGARQPREGAAGTLVIPTVALGVTSTPTAIQPPTSPDRAAIGAVGTPSAVYTGHLATVRITFADTGTSVWSAANGYTLVCDAARHPGATCNGLPKFGLGARIVRPGQSLTFTLNIRAPTVPGRFRTYWNLARNGQIFSTPDAAVALSVITAPAPARTPVPTSGPPAATIALPARATPAPPGPPPTPTPKPKHKSKP